MLDNSAPPVELPIELRLFREAPLPDPATLTHIDRVKRINTYRTIRVDYSSKLTIEELQHISRLMGDARAETLKAQRADKAAGKKASAAADKPIPTLDDLL